jgi:neutral ceramidase
MTLTLHVGVAETTINPLLGMQIDGNIGAYRPAQFIVKDLYARAIVFQQAEKRFLLLCLDLLAITTEWSEAIRDFAAGELGFDRDAVAVHVVQNHSSPSMGQIMLSDRFPATKKHPWIRGSDPDYGPLAMEKIKPMIREAAGNVQPVRLVFGSALESRVSFNRRIAMRDGTSEMGLGSKPGNPLFREGLSDPEVGVALFTTPSLKTIAALLHHTSHPVHWNPHHAIHGDWPGAWAEEVRRELLPSAIPLVLNGCCGNVIHHDSLNPHREDTPQSMAKLLTEAARTALSNPYFSHDDPVLSYKTIRWGIPFRQFPKKVFEDAHKLIAENPEPMWTDEAHTRFKWDWQFAASLVDLEHVLATRKEFEYEIQALRLGDLAILILPGEPFVEAQLDIKQRSPAARTFVAHMSNRYVGYIPTAAAIERGGYETRPSIASKLAPEALQTIANKSVALLQELYSQP